VEKVAPQIKHNGLWHSTLPTPFQTLSGCRHVSRHKKFALNRML